MGNKIITDTKILNLLLDKVKSGELDQDTRSIVYIIEEMRKSRQAFPTLQEAIEEADICLQLIAKRAAKYGEAWKDTRLSSLVDYVLMKYHRVNKMADNPVENFDKLESDLQDAANYALFCLIKLRKLKEQEDR